MTPHTRENPTATRANSPPWRRPETVAWANWAILASLASRVGGPAQGRLLGVPGPDGHHLAVLDLDDRHRLGDVLARRVELDRPEERRHVEAGHGVPDHVGLGRAGVLDREPQRQASGGGLGIVVLGVLAVLLPVGGHVIL